MGLFCLVDAGNFMLIILFRCNLVRQIQIGQLFSEEFLVFQVIIIYSFFFSYVIPELSNFKKINFIYKVTHTYTYANWVRFG